MKSPDNPTLAAGEAPTLASSKGFEGMAQSKDRRTLYPMLEGALSADSDQTRSSTLPPGGNCEPLPVMEGGISESLMP